MKIRSITCFFDPRSPYSYSALDTLSQLAGEGRRLFDQAGIEVQTTRLASWVFATGFKPTPRGTQRSKTWHELKEARRATCVTKKS
ncbi:hypothetical protein ATHL_02881 [Anaerolinea thermolimosa]|nr:hypothetical protein ATHL_02881 [Anaerolinea thermolimosa]